MSTFYNDLCFIELILYRNAFIVHWQGKLSVYRSLKCMDRKLFVSRECRRSDAETLAVMTL